MAFSAVRLLLEPRFSKRLAYTIALGADVYFSKTKELWKPGVQLSRFYDFAQGLMKKSYKDVCNLTIVDKTDDCVLSVTGGNHSGHEMAAFAGPEQLRHRLVTSYRYEMARRPVVIYDIELDDYEGVCHNTEWPLIRTFTEPFNKSFGYL
ncbi:uncharacterized protein LOC125947331 [Dermacentor silvarum]|uniref:uncharacterized protein LOC125947331 n=1 Tax=Dermacentor silvarum TaxID=543639 RepID=UPI0021012C1A|nr:uncharacterized protein LOC125947331 [Dermacentor silvarum]